MATYSEVMYAYQMADKARADAKKELRKARQKLTKSMLLEKKKAFRTRYAKDYQETCGPQESMDLERQAKELSDKLRALQVRKANLVVEQKEKWKIIEKQYEEEAKHHRWYTEFKKNRDTWRAL